MSQKLQTQKKQAISNAKDDEAKEFEEVEHVNIMMFIIYSLILLVVVLISVLWIVTLPNDIKSIEVDDKTAAALEEFNSRFSRYNQSVEHGLG